MIKLKMLPGKGHQFFKARFWFGECGSFVVARAEPEAGLWVLLLKIL